jgi:hypothetical protein
MTALDADGNGEISADELQRASAALSTLDKNRNGEITETELMPDFGGGRFPGGGRRGGFGGRPGRGGGSDSGPAERVAATEIEFDDGVAAIPDHETFHELSYKGPEVMIDTFLAGLEFVKFTLDQAATDRQQLYFINTKTHRAHMMFARVAGLPFDRGDDQMKGVLVYRPMLQSPSGEPGLYTFEFEPFDAYPFEMVKHCYNVLLEKMPSLRGKLGYFPRGERADARYELDTEKYQDAGLAVYRDQDLVSVDIAYLPLNPGASFGRLRLMQVDGQPSPRDIVLYQSLPNEMPRVAGIITTIRQTPLSHVNLRAIQDKIPNAFISQATANKKIQSLIGKYVSYSVTPDGYTIREAHPAEVDAHFASSRPAEKQTPQRDLSVMRIRPLSEIGFDDSSIVGVKAANLAAMRSFGFPHGTVPDGFAVPFYYYDQFMKYNGFYDYAKQLLANPEFHSERATQIAELKKFRSLIKKGKMRTRMTNSLDEVYLSFPKGSSIRCRSSTNNEDLPGFSGAGLYDSFTHKPDEGHLSKSIKQVYASLWNFRAFEEREFYRVDHLAAAMGVLVHPNFKGELANGVAVTTDILYQTDGNYYINTQVGEDLVTNPEELSTPEEMLLDWRSSREFQVMRSSSRRSTGGQLLASEHREQLRDHLGKIHGKFARLYGKSIDDPNFAMEIEFKVTSSGQLAIKQARPWVFSP